MFLPVPCLLVPVTSGVSAPVSTGSRPSVAASASGTSQNSRGSGDSSARAKTGLVSAGSSGSMRGSAPVFVASPSGSTAVSRSGSAGSQGTGSRKSKSSFHEAMKVLAELFL